MSDVIVFTSVFLSRHVSHRERAVRDGVLDGSRAPKLTGRNRYMKVRHGVGVW